MTQRDRDIFLDIAKGLAIMVVVAGHVIQANVKEPDSNFFFRFICSFQMPMFIFVSGMVASLNVKSFFPDETLPDLFFETVKEIWNATIRLFIPFVSWTIVFYFVFHNDGTLSYFKNVLKSPDWSLWFLLALFYCRGFFAIVRFAGATLRRLVYRATKRDVRLFDHVLFAFFLTAILFLVLRKHSVDGFGLYFLKYLFPYYFLGICFYKYKKQIPKETAIEVVCTIVFFALVPFWYRITTGPAELWLENYFSPDKARLLFSSVVALCGTLSFILFTRSVSILKIEAVKKFLVFCGSMTLGIYAFHVRMAWLPPPFIGVLLASLAATWLLERMPVARTLLLGEKGFFKPRSHVTLPASSLLLRQGR